MASQKLIFMLFGVILFAAWSVFSNPHEEFSSETYWKSAALLDVADIPQEALEPGNKNGAVLMWAAASITDPRIITALVDRGANVNEVDQVFSGTPLGAAASESTSPEVIAELIKHGAEVDQRLANGFTALMNAAYWNKDESIVLELVKHGADASLSNQKGKNALEIAREMQNYRVVDVLEEHLAELELDKV